jgi:acetyl-CoA carboxylase biotin carboxyl carrier protein
MRAERDEPTVEDIKAILAIFRESGFAELRLDVGDTRIAVRKDGAPATDGEVRRTPPAAEPAAPAKAAPAPVPAAEPATLATEGMIAVRSPVSGTFYRSPSPGAEPFCAVGDRVEAGTTVGLVEVMKLFTSISAGVAGTVVRIVPENGAMVESGQEIVLIRRDGEGGA